MGLRAQELRLALCMRGGVSLAVWMGGACREIAALLAARSSEKPMDKCDVVQKKIYEFLLRRCGYETVTVDILTGTSAGGLNGVLFATHLMYGTPFDSQIRDIWLQLGDLEGLTRKPDDKEPDSLLLGTDGFYDKVYKQLRRLVPKSDAEQKARRPRLLRLILTATRLYPRNEYLRTSTGTPMLVNWSRAHLVFRHHESGTTNTFTDFPDEESDRNQALSRLAYAARTTSSFPAAFEPAEIEVVNGSGEHNFYGLISETCLPDSGSQRCVQLMDGGILDNVPLAWAIRAIADAPADQAVDRWLLYLEPVPATLPEPPKEEERSLTRLAGVIRALVQAKANSESLLEDATALREAWTTAQKLHGTTAGIPGDPSCAALPGVDRKRYASAVACVEADRLTRLIEDPISLVGPDPLPIPDTGKFSGDESWPLLTALRGTVDSSLVGTGSSFRSLSAAARASPWRWTGSGPLRHNWARRSPRSKNHEGSCTRPGSPARFSSRVAIDCSCEPEIPPQPTWANG
ncbi:patatin-like protein [Lentzea sp. PSKA42]|uniref:Patatin-like protein n=1 Tax=Lentzea indica TaxID=2604800 RepID=A0ABX1FSY9_9PSEU|nr:patatin-like protein [Lentzea indica]NKE62155.1 patatin-like protein [Lentzea indica]